MIDPRGRFGEFLACSRYPECKTTNAHLHRRDVPQGGLRRLPHREALAPGQGVLRLRQLRQDQVRLRQLGPPGARAPCPQCSAPFVVEKVSKAGVRLRCLKEGCGWSADKEDLDAEAPATPPPPPDAKAS